MGTHGIAFERLDLDDLGAEVAEDLCEHVAGEQAGKIQHADTLQRAAGAGIIIALVQGHSGEVTPWAGAVGR